MVRLVSLFAFGWIFLLFDAAIESFFVVYGFSRVPTSLPLVIANRQRINSGTTPSQRIVVTKSNLVRLRI